MNTKNKEFIHWLFNRLQFKYQEDLSVIQGFGDFIASHVILSKKINKSIIDNTCKKFYPDFDIERTPELNIGFNDKERNHMRNMILETIKELSK